MLVGLGDYLGRRAVYSPDAPAFVDAGKATPLRLTFAEADVRATRVAAALRRIGVGQGDRVALLARDGIEHLDAFFACAKLGALHTPFNWRLHWRENLAIIKQLQPRVLLFGDDFAEAVAAMQSTGELGDTALVHLGALPVADSFAFAEWLTTPAPDFAPAPVQPEDIAALIFTGGTTGTPKAAAISHRQIAWNTLNTVLHDLRHGDCYLNVFPLFHTGGLFVYTVPLAILGGTTILVRQFDAAQTLDLIARERVTVFAGVPTMYQMMLAAPTWATADLSSLRFCTSGGAPLPLTIIEAYRVQKGVCFKQGFGMTEFGPGVFALAPDDAERKAGSIGRPNFFVEAAVMDDAGNLLPPEVAGELVLRGPSGSSGYFGNPDATAASRDAAGWFHTGDMARYDAEGYFFIVDRKKDMFISGGENVYPAEIEQALYTHPAVAMCAVVGLPDPKWGEVGAACVVLKPEMTATETELITFLRDRLAGYKVPKTVHFLDALPMSAAGKVLKRELRDRLAPPPTTN
ncbi:MAG: long-chain fatty acid--CoA ligase [Chloracidobacterium sp.]|uniref:Long-chain fatty acid--CoA ligase n=1 Tax=Chloracidobacterium validum TaxID=2821543 RepID=A0ABX8BAX8_9BACT|nr:long-chain fatty acid--CoA ligase [Chloracidobacterium validum]QUW04087.1 long-chain fatty acid--CoA ligase [Chloracidobacterium validum]